MNAYLKLVAFTAILFSLGQIKAQEEIEFTLEELKTEVLENNRSLQVNESKFRKIKAQYRQTNAAFLPQLSVSHSFYRTNNPVQAFGTLLNQGVFTEQDFQIDNLNNPSAISNFTTALEIQQPLINLDKWAQRSALNAQREAQQLQNTFEEKALLVEVEKLYMQLQLAYKGLEVLEQTKQIARQNFETIQNFYDEGLLVIPDVLNAEVRLNEVENEYVSASNQLKNLSDYLLFLMNKDSNAVIKPTSKLELNVVAPEEGNQIETREDVLAVDLQTEAQSKMQTASKLSFLPTLNAFGNVQWFDDEIFSTNSRNFFVGASLNWTVFEGGRNIAKLQEETASLDQAQLEASMYTSQSYLELEKAKRQFREAEQKLNRNRLSLEQAEKVYKIRKDRFEEGLERTTDLLQAEQQQSAMRLSYNQSIFEFNYAQLYVQFLANNYTYEK
ncbi:TolC family protein [Psychroflexus sp. CAK57W]|uniref:TolC family protein n=1 Tax=Psychroflexus curvus TaxID=2873595 RepID=UPI001CCA891D|nr:TolC family protein [Psychroflexus curvus]MBZ9627902.1 TolC family protein [Psychroflexus curvus]MBZ9787579.1 TolC family protein [Psychroflexus curvus]